MSEKSIELYFEELKELELATLLLTDRTDLLDECQSNMICISLSADLSNILSLDDLQAFLQRVKSNRQQQLADSSLQVNLTYYLWVDEMAGQLRAGFINSNHHRLPFGCSYKLVNYEVEILRAFLQSPYIDGIPWEELSAVAENEQLVKEYSEFVLPVFQEELKRPRSA